MKIMLSMLFVCLIINLICIHFWRLLPCFCSVFSIFSLFFFVRNVYDKIIVLGKLRNFEGKKGGKEQWLKIENWVRSEVALWEEFVAVAVGGNIRTVAHQNLCFIT